MYEVPSPCSELARANFRRSPFCLRLAFASWPRTRSAFEHRTLSLWSKYAWVVSICSMASSSMTADVCDAPELNAPTAIATAPVSLRWPTNTILEQRLQMTEWRHSLAFFPFCMRRRRFVSLIRVYTGIMALATSWASGWRMWSACAGGSSSLATARW